MGVFLVPCMWKRHADTVPLWNADKGIRGKQILLVIRNSDETQKKNIVAI